jgi:hypothetical protein
MRGIPPRREAHQRQTQEGTNAGEPSQPQSNKRNDYLHTSNNTSLKKTIRVSDNNREVSEKKIFVDQKP